MTPTSHPLWARWAEVDALFEAALDLPPEQRAAFVAKSCGDDVELRDCVLRLLSAEATPHDRFEEAYPATARAALRDFVDGPADVPERIGGYRVLRQLGRGGMGSVYLAERTHDFEQRVAIKVLRRGLDTEDVIRRFLAERRILAGLQHPNIAALLDGGSTEDGRPFLVMQYVEGTSITTHCEQAGLSIRERLELFLTVCEAVRYAHTRLVVHRDIKPSNIVVTDDGRAVLLDFGIAKLLATDGDTTDLTRTGVRVLTPEYASPEQRRGETITTASDIYQLGVLLYVLLTGHRPAGADSGTQADDDRSTPPPSMVVAGSDPNARRLIAGDLDTITLKALRTEPERRYDSVGALIQDVRRHLAGLPVLARPDTFRYRAQKFVRRNRAGVAAAVIALIALLSGAGAALWQAGVARAEAAKAGEVRDFVLGLFGVSDPLQSTSEELTLRDLLDRGAERVDNELASQPALQAEMLSLLGPIYARLGHFDEARGMIVRARALLQAGGGGIGYGKATHELARVEHLAGNLELADSLYRAAQERLSAAPGGRSADVAHVEKDRAALAYQQGNHVLADSLFGSARTRLAAAGAAPGELLLLDLSHVEVLHGMGTDARADSLYARILAQRDQLDDERSIVAAKGMIQLGFQALYGGDAARAEPLIAGALELRRQVYGDMHSDVGAAMSELAGVQWSLGRHEEALATRTRAVEILRQTLGADHPEYAMRLGSLGVMLSWSGDIEGAIRTLVETERIQREALGEEHFYLAATRRNLGRNLMAQGRYEEALPVLRAALSSWIASMGDRDFFPSQTRLDIAVALAELGQRAAADSLVATVLAGYRARPPRGTAAGDALLVQARLRALDGRIAEAADFVRAALADYDEKGIGDNLARAAAELELGRYLIELGDAVEAERRLRAAHDAFLAQRGPRHPQTMAARELLQQLEPVSQR